MIPVVAMALLALSLNNAPPGIGMGSGNAKSPRPTKSKPPDKPSEDRPKPPPQEEEEPRTGRPDRQVPQYQEEPYLAVIRRNIYQVNSCFDRARTWSPSLQGEVVVEWDIGSAGNVEKAEVTGNTTGKPDLADCILQAVKSFRFNDPDASYPSHVSHAFRLQTY